MTRTPVLDGCHFNKRVIEGWLAAWRPRGRREQVADCANRSRNAPPLSRECDDAWADIVGHVQRGGDRAVRVFEEHLLLIHQAPRPGVAGIHREHWTSLSVPLPRHVREGRVEKV